MGTVDATAKNAAVDAISALVTHFALFDDTDTELTGGSYARKAKVDASGADAGTSDLAETDIVFDVPAGGTVRYIKGMTAVSAGSARATHQLAADEVYGAAGTFTLTAAVISAIDPA